MRSLVIISLVLAGCGSGGGGHEDAATDTTTDSIHEDTLADTGVDAEPDTVPPPTDCVPPVDLVDTSSPDSVVGTGTPGSCTQAALAEAVASGGIVTFDCGPDPHTITLTSELPIGADTVIDGSGAITLSGGGASPILAIHSSFDLDTPSLTVQRLAFTDGARPPTGEDTEDGGGAIHRHGGSLTIIDCTFVGNRCHEDGQDLAGGAVYSIGVGPTVITGSAFTANTCSNGGAIGNLHNDLTLFNTSVTANFATGTGGNPGNGGNGGGIYMDGVGQTLVICGSVISANHANAYGGGLFRVSNDGTGLTDIDLATIDGNAIPDHDPSKAGGLYLQGMAIDMTGTTISGNEARSDGGMFVGPSSTIAMTNVTIAHNTALSSLSGGVTFSGGVTGTVLNCTFALNRAPGELAFAAATLGGEAVTLQNTVFEGHEVGNGWNPITCRDSFIDGGGNIQYPVERAGGGSDDPDSLCAAGVLVDEALLGPLEDNGGPTLTLMPGAASPAIGLGEGCPATDQRGVPRSDPCTSGAVEAE